MASPGNRKPRAAIKKVLVIKLGELADIVLAFPAFERIRAAHRKAKITLLTTVPYASLAKSSPYFDSVDPDGRPTSPAGWLSLVIRLRRAGYDRIYDLQNDRTTKLIFQSMRPFAPAWSGEAIGCSLPHRSRNRARMHPLERQAGQLKAAGIWPDAPTEPLSAAPPNISWALSRGVHSRVGDMAAGQRPLAILAPGPIGRAAERRWPIENYAELARRLQDRGFEIVIVGGLADSELAHVIQRRSARARDLTGRTDLVQIALLGARASIAIGNDMGALQLAAAAAAPTIALFRGADQLGLEAPRGHVTVLHAPALKDLSVDAVCRAAVSLASGAA